jgi:ribonucleoside-diphosphate reductase alpha subunit
MLQKGQYLLGGIESPDFATMRVSMGIIAGREILKREQLPALKKLYLLLSSKTFTFATPTLLNSGTKYAQFSSCVLLDVQDNLPNIGEQIKSSMLYQKHSAGIGVNFSKLRCRGSLIKGTNGVASGLAPLAEVFDKLGYYIDQGGGKRPGSISPYIADFHPDLLEVLALRNIKDTTQAASNHRLYYAVWVSDYFMKCTAKGKMWYFICPSLFSLRENKGSLREEINKNENEGKINEDLNNLFGKEFKRAYLGYVERGEYVRSMPARDVWREIIKIQTDNGVPYIVCKDTINLLRNQNAFIYTSNLCAEITLPTNKDKIGVCNLASVSVRKFLTKKKEKRGNKYLKYKSFSQSVYFNLSKLRKTIRSIVTYMDRIIDINYYPLKQGEYSNKKRRPLGIGIMGLADALCKLKLVFGSEEACQFRAYFQEALYYYALERSIELAAIYGPHDEFSEYKNANGGLHPILFQKHFGIKYKQLFDWSELAERAKTGVRHSVLTACMPTGSTAMIMGNSACFEPYESNIYRFSAHAEELVVINKYLRADLESVGLNTKKFISRFINLSGRIQDLKFSNFVDDKTFFNTQEGQEWEKKIKAVYRVAAFEISPKEIIDMSIAAQPYIDQSQSMNLYIPKLSINYFNWLYYGWKNGLKTLVYYTRSSSTIKEESCKNCVI